MFGFQTVLSVGWGNEEWIVPPGFLRNAWNVFLPKGSLSVLLSTTGYVLQGLSKYEIIKQMKVEEKELHLVPFSFTTSTIKVTDKELYQVILQREHEVREILERSGYKYPQEIDSWIGLMIQLGIIMEVRYKEQLFLDVVIEPFPYPEQALKLNNREIDLMMSHRHLLPEND